MKIQFQIPAVAVMFMFLLTSCTAPAEEAAPVDLDAIKIEIQAMEDAFAAAEKAKDAAAVAAYYNEDAISYGRNSEPSVGKKAIQASIEKRMQSDTVTVTNVYKVVDLFAEGNTVLEVGSWTSLDGAGAPIDKGFYMSYFQKKGGKYECIRDMNVSTTPVKP
jgi:ketosteroid isomerase-like protein